MLGPLVLAQTNTSHTKCKKSSVNVAINAPVGTRLGHEITDENDSHERWPGTHKSGTTNPVVSDEPRK